MQPGNKNNSQKEKLSYLLQNLNPVLQDGEYVFFSIADCSDMEFFDPVMVFREAEGKTMIIEKQQAEESGITCQKTFSWITISVYSSLETVGLTAAFSHALAEETVSCNVVAGFHHDHLFIPLEQTDKAMKILNQFGKEITEDV